MRFEVATGTITLELGHLLTTKKETQKVINLSKHLISDVSMQFCIFTLLPVFQSENL